MSWAIVFDLDDTLYPERAYNLSGFRAVGAYVAGRYGLSAVADDCIALYEAGVRGSTFDDVIRSRQIPCDAAELVAVYREHLPELALFDDACQILARLQGTMPLGLITDGYADVQRRKVAALGLAPRFDALVFSDDEGRAGWKPSPLPYLRVMDLLQAKAQNFVYVGDNPGKDFVTARELGWFTVQVTRPGAVHSAQAPSPGHEAHLRIDDLRALPLHQFGLQA